MLIISSREFREKQVEYMDRADNGVQIIVQRGKNKVYSITPITEDDLYFTSKMLAKIEVSIAQADEGKTTTVRVNEELKQFLGSL
jgi:antitoxin YefM